MDFITDLSEYQSLLPIFKKQIGSYFVSGMMSDWTIINGAPVREGVSMTHLDTQYFSWDRIPASLRTAIAEYYLDFVPGYPLSQEPVDLQYFFWGDEFQLHMWQDVVGGRKNPTINGITLAGWPTFRDWLISEDPTEAALLGSMIRSFSTKGKSEATDPLIYLKSLQSSKDTYLYSGYALWRQQRIVEDYEIEELEEEENRSFTWDFEYEFGW